MSFRGALRMGPATPLRCLRCGEVQVQVRADGMLLENHVCAQDRPGPAPMPRIGNPASCVVLGADGRPVPVEEIPRLPPPPDVFLEAANARLGSLVEFDALKTLVEGLRERLPPNLSKHQRDDIGLYMLRALRLGQGDPIAEVLAPVLHDEPKPALRLVKTEARP